MNFEELSAELKEMGLPKFRATQIYDWLHKKCVASFDEMTNISKDLINKLNDNFVIFSCTIEKKLVSQYDNTVKYLFSLPDGEYLECVVMDYKYGHTICVSTQVGCKMGCAFCASGIGGFKRQLAPSEILGQIYAAQRDLGLRISRIVLMGMGEPLDNYNNVMKKLYSEKFWDICEVPNSLKNCFTITDRFVVENVHLLTLHQIIDDKCEYVYSVNTSAGYCDYKISYYKNSNYISVIKL